MQREGLKNYSLFATVLFVLPVLLQLVKAVIGYDEIVAAFTYLCVVAAFIYNYVDSKRRRNYAHAFKFDNSYRLDVFSYLAAFGFFVEFISNVILVVKCIVGKNALIVMYFIPLVLCALFALLSCFYFVVIGASFGTGGYDFRSFKLYHIVILLWSIFKLITLFGQAVSIVYDINAVLRYLAIMVMAFFFYYFVSEVESEKPADYRTAFCARMCAYCSGFYAIDRLILLITGDVQMKSSNSFFALSCVFICLFSLFFEKTIVHNSSTQE